MGEIADMMVEGTMCIWCGTCFEEEHGYPVVCKSCAEEASEEELVDMQVAHIKEM